MATAPLTEVPNLTDQGTTKIIQTARGKIRINEAGQGLPIVMMHGTGPGATGWSNFNQNFRWLASKYRVILVDLPGWGLSDPVDPSVEPRNRVHVEAVKLLLDQLNIERAALVGNSMGGGVTLQFCATYPERVSHAVTMGAGLGGANIFSPAGSSEGIRIIRETYEDPTPENFRRLVRIMVYDPSFVTDELLRQRSQAALANPTHLANWLKPAAPGSAFGNLGEMMTKLSQFKQPGLFIHGRDDRVVPMEGTLRSVSVFPDSRAVILSHCGHWAQVEHAAEFNVLLDSFLSNNLNPATTTNRAFGS